MLVLKCPQNIKIKKVHKVKKKVPFKIIKGTVLQEKKKLIVVLQLLISNYKLDL